MYSLLLHFKHALSKRMQSENKQTKNVNYHTPNPAASKRLRTTPVVLRFLHDDYRAVQGIGH